MKWLQYENSPERNSMKNKSLQKNNENTIVVVVRVYLVVMVLLEMDNVFYKFKLHCKFVCL